jgi:DNA-directed RNA polymerase subunit RPC12/RpoP
MPDTKFVARCADCGHAYKVPNETKVYPCKECGGDVCAAAEEPELDEELQEEEPTMPEERSIRARHTAKPKSKVPMIVGAVVVTL